MTLDGLLQLIILLVKLVDVVEQLHNLFFRLDESSDNLIDVVDAGSLHDSFEGFLDDLSIADVLVE